VGTDLGLQTIERLVGIALIFMGFIGNLLAITGQYPLDQFTAITFLMGVILFVHGGGRSWHKWIIIGLAAAFGAVFLIRGEVGGLSQVGMFWGTLFVIIFYTIFTREPKESKSDENPPR
jgi:hypothetical protein